MDIDLETCILAFLIGFALYLLVNRVFTEGYEETYNPETGEGINPRCSQITYMNECGKGVDEGIQCRDMSAIGPAGPGNGIPACTIKTKESCVKSPGFVWCGNDWGKNPGQSPRQSPSQSPSQSPRQSPNPSQTPPSESLTDDEKKLKQIIEGAIRAGEERDTDNILIHETPTGRWSWITHLANEIQADILSKLQPYSVVGLSFVFENDDDITDFKRLLQNNTKSLINLNGKPIILKFSSNWIRNKTGGVDAYRTDLSDVVLIANCFHENIIGIATGRPLWLEGNLSAFSGLKNSAGLQYLDFGDTDITGDIMHLNGLKELQYLDFGDTDIKGDIKNLNGLKKLQYLSMFGTHSIPEKFSGDIKNLNGLKELQYLDFSDNVDIKGDIKNLNGLKELQYLDFSGNVDVKGNINNLSGLKELQYLYLCPGNGKIVGDIFSTDNIKNLYMRDPSLQDQSIQPNNDFDACAGIIGVLEVDCSSERYNCNNCSIPSND